MTEINVRAHGAAADGVTDDRDAFMSAIAAAGAAGAGAVVRVLPGVYYFNTRTHTADGDQLTILIGSPMTMLFEPGAVLRFDNGAARRTFVIRNTGNVTIQGGRFEWMGTGSSRGPGIEQSSNVSILNTEVIGFGEYGIWVANDSSMRGDLNGSTTISNVSKIRKWQVGDEIRGAGIPWSPTPTVVTHVDPDRGMLTISQPAMVTAARSALIRVADASCNDIRIEGNYISGIGNLGIEVFPKADSHNLRVTANTVVDCPNNWGIKAGQVYENALIDGNTIRNCYAGIGGWGGGWSVNVSNNVLIDIARWGIGTGLTEHAVYQGVVRTAVISENQLLYPGGAARTAESLRIIGGTTASGGVAQVGSITFLNNIIDRPHTPVKVMVSQPVTGLRFLNNTFIRPESSFKFDNSKGSYPGDLVWSGNKIQALATKSGLTCQIRAEGNVSVTDNVFEGLGRFALTVGGGGQVAVGRNQFLSGNPTSAARSAAIRWDYGNGNFEVFENLVDNRDSGGYDYLLDTTSTRGATWREWDNEFTQPRIRTASERSEDSSSPPRSRSGRRKRS